ncbi:MAG: zf-HC2 domain-containing protein [Armatimonadetes bacterium]|nr:zf-HC2 domain-containing protein [Armatimonadota bacterium]
MSTCPHPYDLQSLVDGALGPRELRQVVEHLAQCEACSARVRDLERLHELLLERRVSAPEGLLDRILDLLRTVIPVRKLTCRQALELASQYIDDELNELERETLEAHLFACDDCFYEYVTMRTAAEAMRSAPAVVPAEGLKDRILAAVGQEAAGPAPAPAVVEFPAWRVRRVLAPAAAIAAVALLTFGVFMAMNSPTSEPAAHVASVSAVRPVTSEPMLDATADESAAPIETRDETGDVAGEAALADAGTVPEDEAAAEDKTQESEGLTSEALDAAESSPRYAEVLEAAGHSVRAARTERPVSRTTPEKPRPAAGTTPAPTSRPVRVIEPPEIAMVPPAGEHRGAGLRTSERTARRTVSRGSEAGVGGEMPAPPMPVDMGTGVAAIRPLPPSGGSPTTLRPGAEGMLATAHPLTRPAQRPVIAARPAEERYEETPESALAHRSLVATVGTSSRTVYSARDTEEVGARLRESSEKINREISRDRRATSAPGVDLDE